MSINLLHQSGQNAHLPNPGARSMNSESLPPHNAGGRYKTDRTDVVL